eukprot:g78158.t1
MFYREHWDPARIVAQMLALQSGFYLFFGAAALVVSTVLLEPIGLEMLLVPRHMQLHSRSGWCPIIALLLATPACAVLVYTVVARAKQVLDFTCSYYLVHVFCCWFYSEFPSTFDWWLVNVLTCLATVLSAEYMCLQREMKDIVIKNDAVDLVAGTPSKPSDSTRTFWQWNTVF